jgi:oxygen-independent coproporphyrinogen-3 oxidase
MTAGVYLHIPFCKSRCSYCDFATDVYRDSGAVERYVHALRREIEVFREHDPESKTQNLEPIDSVYFGGGTPSLLSPAQVELLLSTVRNVFEVSPSSEITMEMNPATVTAESLAAYRSLGVNRASFGVQTFNDDALKLLARGHDANDARTTYRLLRETGFENVSFDLIAGLPGQSMDDWKRNLDEAIAMDPEHMSLYLLEVHQGTPLAEQLRSGRRPMPDEELAAEMYELMIDRLSAPGYEQYEISNFAKPGFESRHNSKYWTLDPVFGFGVSAHSFDGEQRYANDRDTASYVSKVEDAGSAEISREVIDASSEFIFLGLRLTKGIDPDEYLARFGDNLESKYDEEIGRAISDGLLEDTNGLLRLTRRGMLYSNEVFSIFV